VIVTLEPRSGRGGPIAADRCCSAGRRL